MFRLERRVKKAQRKFRKLLDIAKPRIRTVAPEGILPWMKFINPGMITQGNIDLFAHCIAQLPSGAPLIEIGSFSGLSLNHLTYFLRRAGRANVIFSTDEWKFEGFEPGTTIGNSPVLFDDYRAHVKDSFRRNVTLFSGDRLPHHIELDSNAFFARWDARETRNDFFGNSAQLGGPISFAYIDGDHTYAQSKRDFENVDRHLEPGGFIVFDDSGSGKFGCSKVAEEVAALARYELISRQQNYCVRKRP